MAKQPPPTDSGMKWLAKVAEGVPATASAPSKGPTYRSAFAKDGFAALDGPKTCWEIFERSAVKFADKNFLGKRKIVDGKAGEFVFETYAAVATNVKAIASAYRAVGLSAKDRVGCYGVNSPEWFTAMQACSSQSMYCVPLYDTLGADAVEFIINHAEVSIVVVQASKLPLIASTVPKCKATVKAVVSMGAVDDASRKTIEEQSVAVFSWEEFLAKGNESLVDPVPPSPEDYSTIMYTSGTTGEPKGVLLSHAAVVSAIAGLIGWIDVNGVTFDSNDVYLSYLPLAHIFDRAAEEFITYFGGCIGYWQGDVKVLTDDIAALRPTFFCAVPRILDRIYAGVTGKVAAGSTLAKFLYGFFYDRKINRLKRNVLVKDAAPIADALVFGKVKDRLGGRVKLIISGAAPLAPHVEQFLKVAMCCPVVQGYGLTETNAGSFISYADKWEQTATVGPPLQCIETRLESVPEMNYDALGTPARGEICIRGPSLFSGYNKREDLTKEAMDDEGWFHTGDVGEWQPDGSMKIIDRKKNIFKLAQGEYVAVENLENTYGNCPAVDQVWVYGNSFEAVLVAVAVPNEASLVAWAKTAGVEGDFAAVCATDAAKKYILEQLTDVGKKGKLKGFELVKAVFLEPSPFDMERDLLTPTFKKKRPQLLKYYKDQIDAMYASLKAPSS